VNGTNRTLVLDEATNFTGTMSGFSQGDALDLRDFGSSSTLSYTANSDNSGSTLTMTDSTHSTNIAVLGQYMASSFALSSNGDGGTLITNPPAIVANQPLLAPHS
jgi:hypothetical protein